MSSQNIDNKPPAYQWYPKDIFGSTRVGTMTLAEEGAYRRALDFCWLAGSLPNDPKQIARIIGKGCTVKIAAVVIKMFTVGEDGKLTNDRQEQYRKELLEDKKNKSVAGSKGAQKRWGSYKNNEEIPVKKNGTAIVLPLAEPITENSSSSSTASSSSINTNMGGCDTSQPPPQAVKKISKKESLKKQTKGLGLHPFMESEYYDFEKFQKQFEGTDYELCDLNYYYQRMANWSKSKGITRKDWIAQVRNIMLSDAQEGKLKIKSNKANGSGKKPTGGGFGSF